ncbi:MAG: hypothetical protein H0V93_10850 [Euzebyales bacterium]|jgi:hypothetical protein|nr:hypothetical protein [Euzebyales bacterium]
MSRNSRRKRATRPWQHPEAMRDISDLLAQVRRDTEYDLDGYEVRVVDGDRGHKDYVCPSCGNGVVAGESHVVVWPEDDSDLRRHWHKHCWRIEVRRSTGVG